MPKTVQHSKKVADYLITRNAESRANSLSEEYKMQIFANVEFCHLSMITRPGRDFTALGLSHEQGRPRTESGRLCVWEGA